MPDTSSIAILSARGAFYRVPLDNTNAPGMYAVAGLNRPDPSAPPSAAAAGSAGATSGSAPDTNFPILISGIATTQSDIISQVSCLENVKVIYSFGQNFGQLIISGEVLMGPSSQSNKGAIKQIQDYFWKYRVSTRLLPVAVSISENAFYAYLTGLEIHDVMVDFHVLPFVMYGVLLDLSRDTSSLINPKALVLTGGNLTSSSVQNALSQRKSALQIPDITTGQADNADGSTTMPAVLPDNSTTASSPASTFNLLSSSTATPANTPTAGSMTDASAIVNSKIATSQTLTPDEMIYASSLAQSNVGNTLAPGVTGAAVITPPNNNNLAGNLTSTSTTDQSTAIITNYNNSPAATTATVGAASSAPTTSENTVDDTANQNASETLTRDEQVNSVLTTAAADRVNAAVASNQTPDPADVARVSNSGIPAEETADPTSIEAPDFLSGPVKTGTPLSSTPGVK